MTITFSKLRHFLALAEEGHFSRAAERLGISQPAFSRSIAQLERDHGLQLIVRSRTGTALTAAGQDLVLAARQITAQVAAIERDLMLQSHGAAGRVAFGAGPLASGYLMSDLLARSLDGRPRLALTALIDRTDVLIQKVLEGTLDFCICAANGLGPHPTLSFRALDSLRLGFFVRSGHPLADHADALGWDDLRPFPRATGQGAVPVDQRQPSTLSGFDVTVECDDFDVLRRIMLASDTIWLTGETLLATELAQGEAREIGRALSRSLPPAEIVLATLRGRARSAAATYIINTAAEIMAGRHSRDFG